MQKSYFAQGHTAVCVLVPWSESMVECQYLPSESRTRTTQNRGNIIESVLVQALDSKYVACFGWFPIKEEETQAEMQGKKKVSPQTPTCRLMFSSLISDLHVNQQSNEANSEA